MNRYTQAALAALLASVAFIGANANAEEATQPVTKSWEDIAIEPSFYDPIDCYNLYYDGNVYQPEQQEDGTYGEEYIMMHTECSIYSIDTFWPDADGFPGSPYDSSYWELDDIYVDWDNYPDRVYEEDCGAVGEDSCSPPLDDGPISGTSGMFED